MTITSNDEGGSMLTQELLDSYIGKGMGDICLNGYDATNLNHCAHFVGHALNLDFDMTCRKLVSSKARKGGAANVRVHEIFAHCPTTHEIIQCTTDLTGLIFVSGASNFVTDAANISRLRTGSCAAGSLDKGGAITGISSGADCGRPAAGWTTTRLPRVRISIFRAASRARSSSSNTASRREAAPWQRRTSKILVM